MAGSTHQNPTTALKFGLRVVCLRRKDSSVRVFTAPAWKQEDCAPQSRRAQMMITRCLNELRPGLVLKQIKRHTLEAELASFL